MIGKLAGKRSMFLRMNVGTATDEKGIKYEMCTLDAGNPYVRNLKTQQQYVLLWADIINLAKEAGIDKPFKKTKPKKKKKSIKKKGR